MNFKNIVLFGNAKSVFNKEREIDTKYDTICRINAGFPKGKEKFIGSKTDILFLSLALSEKEIKSLDVKQIIWCTPAIRGCDWVMKNSLKYEIKNWEKLYLELNSRPSTGLMAFDYILKTGFKTLTLIGFDFWKTPNWYTNTIHIAQHNPLAEKTYIKHKIEEYRDKIILEKL